MGAERVMPVLMRVMDQGVARTVRVGQAIVSDEEVVLTLEPMQLGGAVMEVAPRKNSRMGDLEWLAQRSRRILEDPKKARWHADMRVQLERIEQEMHRLR